MRAKLIESQRQCAELEEETLFKKLDGLNLDENLKGNIRTCVEMAKVAKKNGIRYSRKWLFECLLLKIKNTQSYEHICRHKMMPLPCIDTMRRYLRRLKPTYGFQSGVFEMLKAKAAAMPHMEKEG